IVNFYPFFHTEAGETSFAIIVQHPKCVVCYGEVSGDSLKRNNLDIGDLVGAGDPVGFISSSGMLHFETYANGTIENHAWRQDDPDPPVELLNPTKYLLSLVEKRPAS